MITKEEYVQWLDSDVTKAFIAHIKTEISEFTKLDEVLCNQVLGGNCTIEKIALDSLSRASIVSGLSLAIDIEEIKSVLVGEDHEV